MNPNKQFLQYFEELKLAGVNHWHFSPSEDAKCDCQECPLSKTRTNIVFGEGSANADLFIIGEAPGAQEDATGRPFVGKSGNLLTKMLSAININRKDVFISNVVKCRPPENRNPYPEEVEKCIPNLYAQLDQIKPKVLLLLGKVPANSLLGLDDKMQDLRTKTHSFNNIPTFITYHPSALLRRNEWKKLAWIDLQNLQKYLGNV